MTSNRYCKNRVGIGVSTLLKFTKVEANYILIKGCQIMELKSCLPIMAIISTISSFILKYILSTPHTQRL